jgi:hypothetical protein
LKPGASTYGEDIRRVTDLLISVPPIGATDERYFVWPVFARYSEPSNNAALGSNDFWGQTPTDTGIIWQFNGKKYLEERDVTLQFRLNSSLSAFPPSLRYAFQVPERLRASRLNGNPGLWLPYPPPPYLGPPGFVNLAPDFLNSGKPQTSHPLYTESTFSNRFTTSGAPLFTYKFLKDDPGYESSAMLDFFFHLGGTPDDLFVARLDINPGASIPPNWYQLVRPFSFEIHDITRQRSGVTILNNVINPNNGESTYVHYQLVKGGQVTIQVFTMDGTMVDILYRGRRDAGEYRAVWGGKNRGGRAVARGMYFVRVVGPDIDEIRKIMVVK